MIDLSRLVEAPGASSLPYVDPAFPNHPLVLHAARPRDYHTGTPVLFVHHGVRRNGKDYRNYWLELVDEAGILAIAIEFPEASFPQYLWYHFGNLHDKDGTLNRREEWTFGIDERLFDLFRAGHHNPATLRVVRPLRGRAVRAPNGLVRFPRPRRRCCQCQCRHLRDAGSGDAVAVWPRPDRCRYRCVARVARLP
jgi:hypothetical protein